MRRATASLSLLAATWIGCAGTIDDPSSFEDYAAVVTRHSDASAAAAASADAAAAQSAPAAQDSWDAGAEQSAPAAQQSADAAASEASSSASSDSDPPSSPAAASCDFKGLMSKRCGGCHSGPSAAAGFDLVSDGLAARLADESGPGPCSSKPMLDREQPEQSALYLIVAGDSCEIRMPIGGTLEAAELECVLQWMRGL
jgi:hypothetical protein